MCAVSRKIFEFTMKLCQTDTLHTNFKVFDSTNQTSFPHLSVIFSEFENSSGKIMNVSEFEFKTSFPLLSSFVTYFFSKC